MKFIILSLFVMPFILCEIRAETYYVKGLWANLVKAPQNNAPILLKMTKGSAVEVIKLQDVWSEVSYQGKKGFLSTLALSSTPPLKGTTLLSNKEIDIGQKARKRASQFTSAASARGLRQSNYDFSASQYSPDFKGLQQVESWRVSLERGWAFLNN